MDLYREPVRYTCPDIDKIKNYIEDAIKECEMERESLEKAESGFSDILYLIEDIPNELENLRDANSSLRDWGNALLDKVNELESENGRLSDLI